LSSSIGIARLASQRAKRLNKSLDSQIITEASHLVLTESLKMKPGRDVELYLKSLFKKVLGTS